MSEDLTKNLPEHAVGNLADVLSAVQDLSERVVCLEKHLAEQLCDASPGWEKLHAGIAQLQEGQRQLEKKLDELIGETRTGLHDLKRQLSVLNDTLLKVRADYKDIEDSFIN
jgi:hypothetical protein